MPTNLSGTVRPKIFDRKTWYPLLYIKISDTTIFLIHCRVDHEIFRLCETNVSRQKNLIPKFLFRKIFSKQKILSKTLGFVCKKFRQCETKKFWQKNVIPPLIHKNSDTTILLKHCRDAHETFRLCETKGSRRKNMVHPFLIRKNFSIRENLSKTVGFVYKYFRQGETKNFRQKDVIPPTMNEFFRYTKFSETLKRCPQIFSALRDKKISTKLCDDPIMHKIIDYRNFLKHLSKAHENFPHCEIENFWRKYVTASIMHKLFRLPQTFWNIEGMPTNSFGTVRPQIFHRKRDTPYYT